MKRRLDRGVHTERHITTKERLEANLNMLKAAKQDRSLRRFHQELDYEIECCEDRIRRVQIE